MFKLTQDNDTLLYQIITSLDECNKGVGLLLESSLEDTQMNNLFAKINELEQLALAGKDLVNKKIENLKPFFIMVTKIKPINSNNKQLCEEFITWLDSKSINPFLEQCLVIMEFYIKFSVLSSSYNIFSEAQTVGPEISNKLNKIEAWWGNIQHIKPLFNNLSKYHKEIGTMLDNITEILTYAINQTSAKTLIKLNKDILRFANYLFSNTYTPLIIGAVGLPLDNLSCLQYLTDQFPDECQRQIAFSVTAVVIAIKWMNNDKNLINLFSEKIEHLLTRGASVFWRATKEERDEMPQPETSQNYDPTIYSEYKIIENFFLAIDKKDISTVKSILEDAQSRHKLDIYLNTTDKNSKNALQLACNPETGDQKISSILLDYSQFLIFKTSVTSSIISKHPNTLFKNKFLTMKNLNNAFFSYETKNKCEVETDNLFKNVKFRI